MNLKTLDYTILENLPKKQKMSFVMDGRFQLQKGYNFYRHSIWNTEWFKKCRYIIKNSVGLHIDDVYSKVSKLIPHNSPFGVDYIISSVILHDERKKAPLKRSWSKTIYIDYKGYICINKPVFKHYHRTSLTKGEKLHRRGLQKSVKNRKAVEYSTLLKLSKNPEKVKYYQELLKEYYSTIKFISEKGLNIKRGVYRTWKNSKHWVRFTLIQIKEKENKAKDLKQKLAQIESGDYSYFDRLKKECHHFENP